MRNTACQRWIWRKSWKKEETKGRNQRRTEKQKALSERNQRIKRDVDRAVQDADTYEEFLEILEYMGYELSGKKHLALREIGAERARRIDLFGEEYTEEMLRCRIEKPPVPAQQEDRKEAELLYIYIPYRNRHLTRHQKECFIRKYRAGKIHKSPKSWEYKSSLQALKRLQEEYIFWAEHDIRSIEGLSDAKMAASERMKEVREKKRELEEEKSPIRQFFIFSESWNRFRWRQSFIKRDIRSFPGNSWLMRQYARN